MMNLPDEGFFQKLVVHTKFDIYVYLISTFIWYLPLFDIYVFIMTAIYIAIIYISNYILSRE